MKPFTQHTQQQGVTYLEHLYFASGIAWHLSSSVFAFTAHAIFPFIHIDKKLDLEATSSYLQMRNHWIENISLNERESLTMTVETENSVIDQWDRSIGA